MPLAGGAVRQLLVDGRSDGAGDTPANVTMVSAGPRYFDALDARLVRGRAFELNDGGPGHEVAIINERTAALYFGTIEPIGARVRLIDDTPAGRAAPWATIVGIVPNIRQRSFGDPNWDPVVYIPHVQSPVVGLGAFGGLVRVVARGRSDPGQLAKALRSEIAAIDSIWSADIRTPDQELRSSARPRIHDHARLCGIAMVPQHRVVCGDCLFGDATHAGNRPADGSQTNPATWLILLARSHPTHNRLDAGPCRIRSRSTASRHVVPDGPADPVTWIRITVLLTAAAVTAALWPAWQATRLDPVTALRYE